MSTQSPYEALGSLLDLIQYKRLLKEIELSDKEFEVFSDALATHERMSER